MPSISYYESRPESKERLTLAHISIVTGHCCCDTELLPLQAQSEPNCDAVWTFVCLSPAFKMCDKIENPTNCEAVSYTHLDVYKRQAE